MPLDEKTILKITNALDNLEEHTSDIKEDVSKIKEAIYNPDDGLYSRLKDVERFKKVSSKVTWLVVSSVLGLAVLAFWRVITSA